MKKFTLLFSTATALVMLLGSCKDSSPFEGYVRAENGLYYKFFVQNENGVKGIEGDRMTIRYIFTNQKNDSVLMDSKQGSQDGSGFVEIGVQKPTFKGSLEDGLLMMAKGDSASFIVPADSFFLKTMRMNELPKQFKSGDHIKAVLKVKDIKSKAEVEQLMKKQQAEMEEKAKAAKESEQANFDKYIADNKITAKPTASGLIYVETKKGSGPNPKVTDIVKVHYTGKLLDGKKFDSSVDRGEPVEFPLNRVIPGWTEGVQLMRKGGKCNLIIPSAIAYGPQGQNGIPPYSPLVFEIELIDIKPAPPEQQGPPQGQQQQQQQGHEGHQH